MTSKHTHYSDALRLLKRQDQLRTLKPMIPINGAFILFEDKKMLSFCSHDYLGMGDSPEVKRSAIKYLLEHGLAATTRPQGLYLSCQQKLQQLLSRALRRESTLLFPSRFEANAATLSTLTELAPHFFIDQAAHPSFFEGAKRGGAKLHTYPHKRLDILKQLLITHRQEGGIIAIESIFSLTGSITNIPKIAELAKQTNHLLLVDDSHALGICGVEGMGLAAHMREVDIITSSLGKALGACGGLVATTKALCDYLVCQNPLDMGFSLAPPFMGAVEAALTLIPQMEGERKQLEQRSHWLRGGLKSLGFDMPKASTPLISLLFNSPEEAEQTYQHVQSEGILLNPTRDPAGAVTPRLNLMLNVCHTPDHFSRLIDALKGAHTASRP